MVSYSIIQVNHTMMKGTQKKQSTPREKLSNTTPEKNLEVEFLVLSEDSSSQLSKFQKGIFSRFLNLFVNQVC